MANKKGRTAKRYRLDSARVAHWLGLCGKTHRDLSKHFNVKVATLRQRNHRGWSVPEYKKLLAFFGIDGRKGYRELVIEILEQEV